MSVMYDRATTHDEFCSPDRNIISDHAGLKLYKQSPITATSPSVIARPHTQSGPVPPSSSHIFGLQLSPWSTLHQPNADPTSLQTSIEDAKDTSVSECTWTLRALEALHHAALRYINLRLSSLNISRRNPCSPFFTVSYSIKYYSTYSVL